MDSNNNLNILEALLFACGEPVEIERLAEVMELDESVIINLADTLSESYEKRKAGFKLIRLDNKLQLCSRADYFDYVRKILELKRNAPLSQAAFEVLAVIAYNQPVTKSVVEQVRGVDCSGVIYSLCEKGLIEEKGRLELPGRPLVYGTTDNFLRCFSMRSLGDLPPLPQDNEEDNSENNDEDNNEPSNIETDEEKTHNEV
ncbi:MAG: SMC-Scp complex subunit ScpB [Acutalibacteraceae bacterium]|nr:SMC-Scp complex subunit ScpB [Acutalibacteraceae bacterium]